MRERASHRGMIAHGRAPFCGLVCRVESVPSAQEKTIARGTYSTPDFAPHAAAPLSEPATCTWATTDVATCETDSVGGTRHRLSARSRDRPRARTKSERNMNNHVPHRRPVLVLPLPCPTWRGPVATLTGQD
jgi:hypothetical protein